MKLAIGSWKLKTGNARSGIALIVTLTIMALLLILATAFVVNMRSERQVSLNFRRQVMARQAALGGLHMAVAKMNYFFGEAEKANASVATMGGRFYFTNVINSTARDMLMFSRIERPILGTDSNGEPMTNWADRVNLNAANYNFRPTPPKEGQSTFYLPIANASVPRFPWGADRPAVNAAYIRLYPYDDNDRPRFAFWIDDESSKINVSNAYGKDLNAAGINNLLTNYSTSMVYPPYPYAKIVQVDPLKGSNKEISTVDLEVLDIEKACPKKYPSNPHWSKSSTKIDDARSGGSKWRPFLGPEEVLGVADDLTMRDYQAVKSCLTAWSVEKDDLTQIIMNRQGYPVPRTNVSMAITNPGEALKLYNFLINTNDLENSASLKKIFFNASFGGVNGKYPATTQPSTNGSVQQIAANIISYITDTTKTPPYGAGVSGTPNLPTGYCGLWKAAYMNEIAFSFCWQKVVTLSVPPTTKFQLWAAMCVELINPYEIKLPRSAQGEFYTLTMDPDSPGNPPLAFAVSWDPTTFKPPAPIPVPNSVVTLDVQNPISQHSYSMPANEANPESVPWVKWQWPITAEVVTNTPPIITKIDITMPKAIRQTMNRSGVTGIIDWFDKKQSTPNLSKLTLQLQPSSQPPQALVGSFGQLGFTTPSAETIYWPKTNPARISIAKNDPRVHLWYGKKTSGGTAGITGSGAANAFGLTLNLPAGGDNNGQNPETKLQSDGTGGPVDFSGGDYEPQHNTYAANAKKPEWRSNFVIAEGGMNSIGELGYIHTGKPWRSLSLQAYGAQLDEREPSGRFPKPLGDLTAIPDWAMLDLFTVNTPPIYGRVNINNGGWHFGAGGDNQQPAYEGNDPTRYPTRPNLLASWADAIYNNQWKTANITWWYMTMRTSAYNYFYYNPVVSPSQYAEDTASVPLAAALNVLPDYRFRNKLANYICYRYHFADSARSTCAPMGDPSDKVALSYAPYFTIGQICEVPCMTNHFASDGTTSVANGNPIAYTDADKEDTVRRIINVLTTHGDVFTVHVVGYTPWPDYGEVRLMAVVERVRDPAVVNTRTRFRILQTRWLSD